MKRNPNIISVPASGVAEMLSISERHVRKLNAQGLLPRPISLGRCVRWNVSELEQWHAAGAPSREQWEELHQRNTEDIGNTDA